MRKRNLSSIIGLLAAFGSMVLWSIFALYNPYTHEPVEKSAFLTTLFTLFAPACAALLASLLRKPSLMFIAFIWSLPISLYLTMTPSIFKWFGLTSFLYLISGIVMLRKN